MCTYRYEQIQRRLYYIKYTQMRLIYLYEQNNMWIHVEEMKVGCLVHNASECCTAVLVAMLTFVQK